MTAGPFPGDQGAQPPATPAPPMVTPNPQEAIEACLRAIQRAAEDSAGADNSQEVSDYGRGALAFAQTAVLLDPNRLAGGATPDAQAASAPTPAPQPPSPLQGGQGA